MENLEGLNRGEQQKENRELLAYSNTFTRDEAIYEALVAKGEPIEIEEQGVEELAIYCPKEKALELASITTLLKLSPTISTSCICPFSWSPILDRKSKTS